ELERLNTDDRESGVLTYDGVHMLPAGNALIADEIASSLASAIAMPEHTTELGLVPAPRSVEKYGLDRRVGLTHVHVTTSNRELEPQRAALEAQLVALGATVDRDQGAKIELRLDTTLGFRDLYRLDVSSMEITVSATRADIVPYASADLLQLCSASVAAGDKLWVPHATILDGPGVDFRALLVDVARKPHSLRVLKQLVELCHFYKLRYLQLHLTDDQAFTFPSIAFPELVTPEQHYTQAELRELVAYADARGVVLIPELEMPGHCGQLVARKPELFRASPLHHATIDFANPAVVAAMETLVAEACDVFRSSPWFHIGGDECDLEHVADSPHFAPALAREGVANARELYRKFLVHMHAVVKRHGKRTLVWEGFAPGGEVEIPRDLVVVAYEALYYPPDALLRDGYTVVNAAWKPLYVVNDRRWSPREIYGWNRFLWQHFIEGFPAFRGLQVAPNELVLGAMLCAWEQPESAELESLVERVPAFAERLWRPKLRSDFADFERRRAAGAAALAKLLDGVR
ncbi:MAG: family 20 glycosylhydrolase, partial [Planctomycetes bacterium]|nr:family 20 glycosylhydrolase [Planctomycetota bacterium]